MIKISKRIIEFTQQIMFWRISKEFSQELWFITAIYDSKTLEAMTLFL